MNKPAKSFKDIKAWQSAHEMVLMVYQYTTLFPKEELFGLNSQFRRAAVSVAANIAEGFSRSSSKEKIRFLNIAQGSLSECSYFYLLANDLNFGENEGLDKKLNEASYLLNSYTRAIRDNKKAVL